MDRYNTGYGDLDFSRGLRGMSDNIEIWVDPINGNDSNSGLMEMTVNEYGTPIPVFQPGTYIPIIHPIKSRSLALSRIPRYVDKEIVITMMNDDPEDNFSSWSLGIQSNADQIGKYEQCAFGPGSITIRANSIDNGNMQNNVRPTRSITAHGMYFEGIHCRLFITGFESTRILFSDCPRITIHSCTADEYLFQGGTNGSLYECWCNDDTTLSSIGVSGVNTNIAVRHIYSSTAPGVYKLFEITGGGTVKHVSYWDGYTLPVKRTTNTIIQGGQFLGVTT